MDPGNPESQRKSSISTLWILVLVMALVLVVFTLQNQGNVSVKLFFWTIKDIPVPLLIIICLLLGYLIPYFSLISRIWKLKRELRRTREVYEEVQDDEFQDEEQEPAPPSRVKSHPEGIAFDDDDPDLPQRKNATSRFFKD